MKNQIKKVLSIVLVAVMCLSTFAIGASAEECTHANKVFHSKVEATCTTPGYDAYKCPDCGDDVAENIVKPTGHKYDVTETVEATCATTKKEISVCSVCGHEKVVGGTATGKTCVVDPKAQSSYKYVKGQLVEYKLCTVCGGEVVLNAADHEHKMEPDWDTIVKPTCDKEGLVTYVCTEKNCTEKWEVVVEKTHQLKEVAAKDPTCTTDGNIKHFVCTLENCKKYFVEKTVDKQTVLEETTADKVVIPASHTWDKGTVVTEEDCVLGVYEKVKYVCTVAGCEGTKTETATEFKHDYMTDVNKSYDATCVKYGIDFEVCTKCGVYEANQIAPKGHLLALGADKTAGTEDDERVLVTALLDAANITKYAPRKVAVCGDYACYVYVCLDPKCEEAHAWDGTTCSVKDCDLDHKVTSEVWVQDVNGAKTEHEFVAHKDNAPKAPTCTETGKKEYYVCKNCGDTDPARDGKDIKATGHQFGTKIEYCSVTGRAAKACTVCGYFEEIKDLTNVTIPEGVSHYYAEKDVQNATCVVDGSKTIYCKLCDTVDTEEVIPATGHSYSETPVVVPGSCQDKTLYVYSCTNKGCDNNTVGHNKLEEGDYDCTPEGHERAMTAEQLAAAKAAKVELRVPTCTVQGLYEYECGACKVKYTKTGEYGHTVIDYEIPADCTQEKDGTSGKYCQDCKKFVGETITLTFEHTWNATKFPAQSACGNDYGWAEFEYCTVCEEAEAKAKANAKDGEEYKKSKASINTIKDAIKVKGHDYVDAEFEGVAETCTTTGIMAFHYCKICGDLEALKADKKYEIDKLPHMEGEDKTYAVPTCERVGFVLTYCDNCDEKLIVDFKYETGHAWSEKEYSFNLDDKAADYICTEDGYKYNTCDNGCGEINKIASTIVKAHHVDAEGNDFTSSCLVIDEDTYCVVCKKDIEVTHNYNKAPTVVEPSCFEDGYEIYLCGDCKDPEDNYFKILPQVGHHTVYYNETTETWVIPADAKLVKEECVAPTHTAEGKNVYLCGLCDEKIEVTLDKLSGIEMEITAQSGIFEGAHIVNGGKVQFVIKLNVADIDASMLQAQFVYNADVLKFESAEVAPIFDAYNEKNELAVKTETVYNAIVEDDMGGLTIISDASNTADGKAVDANLNGEIAYAVLTFSVSEKAYYSDGAPVTEYIMGAVTELTNTDHEITASEIAGTEFDIHKIGSINGDKYINTVDALAIKQIMFGELKDAEGKVIEYLAEADIDKDGQITLNDYVQLRKYLIYEVEYEALAKTTLAK